VVQIHELRICTTPATAGNTGRHKRPETASNRARGAEAKKPAYRPEGATKRPKALTERQRTAPKRAEPGPSVARARHPPRHPSHQREGKETDQRSKNQKERETQGLRPCSFAGAPPPAHMAGPKASARGPARKKAPNSAKIEQRKKKRPN